jgi:feruloyl esterase
MQFYTPIALFSLLQVGIALSPGLSSCESLNKFQLSHSKIRFTTPIADGSNFTGDSPETSYNTLQTSLPASCRVAAVVQTSNSSSARFEIWLLASAQWNSRFLAVGNGGWAGGVNYPDIVTGLKKGQSNSIDLHLLAYHCPGFATMSTDTGHNSTQNDAIWTGNAEQMIDL